MFDSKKKAKTHPPTDAEIKPGAVAPAAEREIVIHTMPKEFLNMKIKHVRSKEPEVKIAKLKKDLKAPVAPVVIAAKPPTGSKRLMLTVIVVLIVLLGGSLAGYFFLIKPQPGSIEIPVLPPPNIIPDPVPDPEPEPASPTAVLNPEPEPSPVDSNLIQKVAISYDAEGNKIAEAVLSLEKETGVNYGLITLAEYVVEEHPEYFTPIAGRSYEVKLRNEKPVAPAIMSITYMESLLEGLDVIPADLRIGFLSADKLAGQFYRDEAGQMLYLPPAAPATGTVDIMDTILGISEDEVKYQEKAVMWEILKAADVDDGELQAVSSIIPDGAREGIYAIVPLDINERVELIPPTPVGTREVVREFDNDQDLLSDKEELIYGSNPMVMDTDQDGYSDGQEVLNLYSPARGTSMNLVQDRQFGWWQNRDYNYAILIPQINTPIVLDTARDIILKASDTEAILVGVQDNPENKSIGDWLKQLSPEIDLSGFDQFITRFSKFSALGKKDGTTYYVQIPGNPYIYIFSYTAKEKYSYLTTFRAIVESIKEIEDTN